MTQDRLAYFGRQKNLVRAFILLCCVGGLILLAVSFVDKNYKPVDEVFPSLRLSNLAGEDINLFERHKGKTLLVNYWATWCPPCLAEIPSLLALQAKKKSDEFDVVFISLDFPENMETFQKRLARYKLETLDTLYMSDSSQFPMIGGRGLPITVLVGPDQKIKARMEGAIEWDGPAGEDFLERGMP